VSLSRAPLLLLLRVAAGGVFMAFGIGKFVNRGAELASFRTYGLPFAAVFVVCVGVLESVGGLSLIVGRFVRLSAVLLAGDMLGAIVVSGIARGEWVSLTIAPAELVAMCVLIWAPLLHRSRTAQDRDLGGSVIAGLRRWAQDDAPRGIRRR
jgi:uncharacterized membrane protein YphA (DoxX/SURF4 family)